jgi:glutaredoxin
LHVKHNPFSNRGALYPDRIGRAEVESKNGAHARSGSLPQELRWQTLREIPMSWTLWARASRAGRLALAVLAAVGGTCLSAPAQAQSASKALYKTVGKDGVVTYTDQPSSDARIEKILPLINLPASQLPRTAVSRLQQLRKSDAVAGSSSTTAPGRIQIFTAQWCGYCRSAKSYLHAHGIDFEEFDVESGDGLQAYARAGGTSGIPLLVAGDRRVRGFSDAAYDAFFRTRE